MLYFVTRAKNRAFGSSELSRSEGRPVDATVQFVRLHPGFERWETPLQMSRFFREEFFRAWL